MSYEICKNISTRGGKITLTTASNNIRPLYWKKWEAGMDGYSEEQNKFQLFKEVLDGNIQFSTLNNNTIHYAYALAKVKQAIENDGLDGFRELYMKSRDMNIDELMEFYKKYYSIWNEAISEKDRPAHCLYCGLYACSKKFSVYGFSRFSYGLSEEKSRMTYKKAFIMAWQFKDYKLTIAA